ncbi:MAG: hypothetical protein OXI77_17185 [Chloroflexota bacterium]|nr:hypothetical protein [Chloroflexota bacterium]MDE2910996.1 hypothetical protein [Chloroflexota bacterium]
MSKERRKVEWSLDLENLRVRAGQFVTEQIGEPAMLKRASLREELEGARAAQITIANPVGRTTVRALDADSPNLFQAELHTIGDYDFDVSGGGERVILLRFRGGDSAKLPAMIGKAQELYCDIGLARGLPMTLKLAGSLGKSALDLSQLLVECCRVETGLGEVSLTAPLQDAGFALDLIGGVGKTNVTLPAGASGRLKITGGVGGVCVSVARGSAVDLRGKIGLGRINLPDGLEGGASDNWRTPGFAEAADQIVIDYKGGIGSFSLEYIEVL